MVQTTAAVRQPCGTSLEVYVVKSGVDVVAVVIAVAVAAIDPLIVCMSFSKIEQKQMRL